MERSGLLASGVEAVRMTVRGHNGLGISSRGVEGTLLAPDVVERRVRRLGRWSSGESWPVFFNVDIDFICLIN